MYVVAIRPDTREVVIGPGDQLFGHTVTLAEVNWLADPLAAGDSVLVQCRYRAAAVPGRVRELGARTIALDLAQPVRAITPGNRAPCTTGTAACSAAASSPNSRPRKPLPTSSLHVGKRAPGHGPIW